MNGCILALIYAVYLFIGALVSSIIFDDKYADLGLSLITMIFWPIMLAGMAIVAILTVILNIGHSIKNIFKRK